MYKCACMKCDLNGESDCEFAKFDPGFWDPVCTHPCVCEVSAALKKAVDARVSAEKKLAKYRDAIRPFVKNCREVIAAVDSEKEAEVK